MSLVINDLLQTTEVDRINDPEMLRNLMKQLIRKYHSEQNTIERLQEENQKLKFQLGQERQYEIAELEPETEVLHLQNELIKLQNENRNLQKHISALIGQRPKDTLDSVMQHMEKSFVQMSTKVYTSFGEPLTKGIQTIPSAEYDQSELQKNMTQALEKITAQQQVIHQLQKTVKELKSVLSDLGVVL